MIARVILYDSLCIWSLVRTNQWKINFAFEFTFWEHDMQNVWALQTQLFRYTIYIAISEPNPSTFWRTIDRIIGAVHYHANRDPTIAKTKEGDVIVTIGHFQESCGYDETCSLFLFQRSNREVLTLLREQYMASNSWIIPSRGNIRRWKLMSLENQNYWKTIYTHRLMIL